MPFYVTDNGFQIDISDMVQRHTVQYRASLSVDIDARGGESTLHFGLIVNPAYLYKPRAGNLITWIADDGTDITILSGIIIDATQILAGFNDNGGEAVMHYEISARDPSYLLEKKYIEAGIYNQKITEGATDPKKIPTTRTGDPKTGFKVYHSPDQHRFPDFVGNNPGEFVDLLAVAGDPRFGIPVNNDPAGDNDVVVPNNYHVGRPRTGGGSTDTFARSKNYHLGRMTYKDAIDQICREAGLLWWIDSEWNFHHKSFPTIVNTFQSDSAFNIDDESLNYYDFELREDLEKWVTRVKVIGTVHDAGEVNPQNRKKGKQKTEEIEVMVTAGLEVINTLRSRLGFDPLPEGTDVDALPDSEPGIWMTIVNAPNVYLHKENGDPDPTKPDYSLLNEIGYAYLLRYAQPDVVGSVCYNSGAPQIGTSIVMTSAQRGIESIVVPIVAVEIDTNGSYQGNDEEGKRKYIYKAHFRGPSLSMRYARLGTSSEILKHKPERLLKPLPPTVRGADVYAEASGEVLSQMQVSTTVTARVLLPNYSQSGDPYGGTITDEYPSFPDVSPDPPPPPPDFEQTRRYYPPVKKPWTITDGFGTRTHPVTGQVSDHPAIDIAAAKGTPIYAIFNGIIAVAEHNPQVNLAGKYIKLNCIDGAQAVYAHLSKIIVKQGQSVKRGQIIGYTGNTGRSTGPHLHFGIKKNGVPVNPQSFNYYDDREHA
jgi:murein DD-endopeptidase MepM/ murein hydrolase activator NlpD